MRRSGPTTRSPRCHITCEAGTARPGRRAPDTSRPEIAHEPSPPAGPVLPAAVGALARRRAAGTRPRHVVSCETSGQRHGDTRGPRARRAPRRRPGQRIHGTVAFPSRWRPDGPATTGTSPPWRRTDRQGRRWRSSRAVLAVGPEDRFPCGRPPWERAGSTGQRRRAVRAGKCESSRALPRCLSACCRPATIADAGEDAGLRSAARRGGTRSCRAGPAARLDCPPTTQGCGALANRRSPTPRPVAGDGSQSCGKDLGDGRDALPPVRVSGSPRRAAWAACVLGRGRRARGTRRD